jgi:hypothetical protein
MKIRYTDLSAKAGQVTHIENGTGKVLIALGQAEEVKLPPRGSAGWLEQRNEQAKLAGPPHAGDTPVPFTENVEWAVRDRLTPTGTVCIIRRFQYLTEQFDQHCIQTNGFPADCPQSIIRQYNLLTQQAGVEAEALHEARLKQQDYDRKVDSAKRW